MKRLITFSLLAFTSSVFAESGESIADRFEISAADKVITIWERIFDSKRYKKIFPRSKRGIYLDDFKQLSKSDLDNLKDFLIEHAADSAKPKVAGGI